jgi:hypothetical protein
MYSHDTPRLALAGSRSAAERDPPRQLSSAKSGVVQRKITLTQTGQRYSMQDGNLSELEQIIRQRIPRSDIYRAMGQSLEQVLTRYDFQNRRFLNLAMLTRSLLAEVEDPLGGERPVARLTDAAPDLLATIPRHATFTAHGMDPRTHLQTHEGLGTAFPSLGHVADSFITSVHHQVRGRANGPGPAIPQNLHHFWAGGALSPGAYENLSAWTAQAAHHGWNQYIMTDSLVNEFFRTQEVEAKVKELESMGAQPAQIAAFRRDYRTQLQRQLATLGARGATVVDMAQLPLGAGHGTRDNPLQTAYRHMRQQLLTTGQKRVLPYLSDLARYSQLYRLGGVYADVDIHPGTVNLGQHLNMPEATGLVPHLGPGFRTQEQARDAGLFSPRTGDREAGLLDMFTSVKSAIGNHFIGTAARNPLIRTIADRASDNLLRTDVTNGGLDVLWAMNRIGLNYQAAVPQSVPPWLLDARWVTDESDHTVD